MDPENETISFRKKNMEECGYPYKISVIVLVGDGDENLRETLSSIANQTIGFEENIQLILVDNTTQKQNIGICADYLERYPDNFVYINLPMCCVQCEIYNAGIMSAKGMYINFIAAGEVWNWGAFEYILSSLTGHLEVYAAVCKAKHVQELGEFWVSKINPHRRKRRMVSIFKPYEQVQECLNGIVFSSELLNGLSFGEEEGLVGELSFFTRILLKSKNVISIETALCLKKETGTVTSAKIISVKELRKLSDVLCLYSQEHFQDVVPYVQTILLSYLAHMLDKKCGWNTDLTSGNQLWENVRSILQQIEDDFIGECPKLKREQKMFLLSMKYGRDISSELKLRNKTFRFHNVKLFTPRSRSVLKITNLDIRDDTIKIHGKIGLPVSEKEYSIFAVQNDGLRFPVSYYTLDKTSRSNFFGIPYCLEQGFSVQLPLIGTKNIFFLFCFKCQEIKLRLNFQFVSKLTNKLKNSYCILGKYILRKEENQILVEEYSQERVKKLEHKVWKELLFQKKLRTFLWRFLIYWGNCLCKKRKKIWIFIDYFIHGDDNAEALFQYVLKQKNPEVKPYFVISKNSPDYRRIRQYATVIPYDTKRYRFMFAISDAVITSQTFFSKRNTFYERTDVLKDLFHFKYVYLQHGVIKDNHADTLAHYKTNLDMLITSAKPEFDSLMTEEYQLSPDIVKLTGLARYDKLYHVAKKAGANKILFAPTWRRSQTGVWDETIQGYQYQEDFKNSEFFQFFNGLITDERILGALEDCGYKIEIQLHPRIWSQRIDFFESEYVKVEFEKCALENEIQDTALLVTDYSSIAFDYAFVKTPIVYMQFDKELFYANHAYTRGYFDFEKDGFGPVCYDFETAVEQLTRLIRNKCRLDPVYESRIDDFFTYRDGRNCERIYQEILKLDKEP